MKKPSSKPKKRGEDYLDDTVSIELKLENGEQVVFTIRDELHVPDDPDKLLEAARKAPARLSFWAYQEQRALANVRKLERTYDGMRGEWFLRVKKTLDEDTDFEYVSNDLLRGVVDGQPETKKMRLKLDNARNAYGVIRSVRNSLEHYCFITRKLIAQEAAYAK